MWTPRHKITNATATLLGRLGDLAREVDDGLLAAASADARREWARLRGTWPTADDVLTGVVALSDEELERMIGKVLRFRCILRSMPSFVPRRGEPRPVALLAAAAA